MYCSVRITKKNSREISFPIYQHLQMFPVKLIFVLKVLMIFNREEVVKETFEHIKLELHSSEVKLPKVTESRFRQSM